MIDELMPLDVDGESGPFTEATFIGWLGPQQGQRYWDAASSAFARAEKQEGQPITGRLAFFGVMPSTGKTVVGGAGYMAAEIYEWADRIR